MAEDSDRRIAAGDARPLEGLPVGVKDLFCTEGIADHGRLAHPRRLRAALRVDRDREALGCGRGADRQDQSRRVRDGLVDRDQLLRAHHQPMDACRLGRAAGAGRQLGRLDRGGRSAALPGRDRHRYRRLDPPAGGALRRGRHEAYLWPLLALWHRRVRELARPGRPDRPHGRGLRAAAAADGGLRSQGQHQRRPAARRSFGGPERRCPRPAGRHPQGVPAGRHAARDRGTLAAGHRLAAGRRLQGRRGQPAAHQICTARLLHRGAGRGVLEPRALRRHALRPADRRQGPPRHLCQDARGGLRPGGAPARDDRHLRALGRLLRCLLHQGAEGAQQDPARFSAGVRDGRPAADADYAQCRIPDRREDGRSDPDVSERRVHGAGQSRGPAGHLGAGGAVARRAAAGAAADRAAVRRGDGAARRGRAGGRPQASMPCLPGSRGGREHGGYAGRARRAT